MAQVVTLELSDGLARQARKIAADAHQRFEDVLINLLERSIMEILIESLPDEEVLELCEKQLNADQQKRLDSLLTRNREGELQLQELRQLDDLMQIYRQGLVRKARAWKTAVDRGLKPPLNYSNQHGDDLHSAIN